MEAIRIGTTRENEMGLVFFLLMAISDSAGDCFPAIYALLELEVP